MKSKDNFLDRFLKHIGNPSITDFITKIINIEGEGVMEWLISASLIPKVVAKLNPSCPAQVNLLSSDATFALDNSLTRSFRVTKTGAKLYSISWSFRPTTPN